MGGSQPPVIRPFLWCSHLFHNALYYIIWSWFQMEYLQYLVISLLWKHIIQLEESIFSYANEFTVTQATRTSPRWPPPWNLTHAPPSKTLRQSQEIPSAGLPESNAKDGLSPSWVNMTAVCLFDRRFPSHKVVHSCSPAHYKSAWNRLFDVFATIYIYI